MANRILTTHVGSLVRPPKFAEVLRAVQDKKELPPGTYENALTEAVANVVRQQAEAGVDIVSDGEFGKIYNWAFYVHSRLTNIVTRPLTEEERKDEFATAGGGRDRKAFPEYYAEADKASGLASRLGNRFINRGGPITYVGQKDLQRDIDNLKNALSKVNVEGAFLPVVAPASALPGGMSEFYPDERSYLFALAEALRVEYRTIVDAGLYVQIDDAFLPFMQEKLVPPMSLAEYKKWAQLRIDALNHALVGIPPEKSRYHICWGSWSGPHAFDVEMKDFVDLLLQVNVGAYSFEAANVRHEHEWKVWKTVKLPAGKKILPGVISHATNVLEHPELIADRLIRFADVVGKENVMASSDCGFAQSPFAQRVHPSIMWAKLKSMAEGARMASEYLWGKRAA
ncbi:MAG TPA: cobalamin-independent methionine synthase II family protein [Xanthobacteraceae bacterium]|jgi:5-methyltetrahydropteroyltriglutamate--homocysteine methyltransferase|nr:cobalamin-independent methionine synthase II family protein [Xanthobacteraceae bacterium]